MEQRLAFFLLRPELPVGRLGSHLRNSACQLPFTICHWWVGRLEGSGCETSRPVLQQLQQPDAHMVPPPWLKHTLGGRAGRQHSNGMHGARYTAATCLGHGHQEALVGMQQGIAGQERHGLERLQSRIRVQASLKAAAWVGADVWAVQRTARSWQLLKRTCCTASVQTPCWLLTCLAQPHVVGEDAAGCNAWRLQSRPQVIGTEL